jgi:hypothetical protein
MLRVVQHPDAGAFLDRAEAWLLEREGENNVMLSVAYLIKQGAKPFQSPAYLATIEIDDRVAGCAMRPPPDGVYLTEIPNAAIRIVVDQLGSLQGEIPEVMGPSASASEFARQWRPDGWVLRGRLQRYTLDLVVPPRNPAPGSLRLGQAADLPMLDEWAAAYRAEVGSKVDAVAFFRTMVERGLLYLWDDDGPRCVVTASGLTPNGARISAAYTPKAFRGNGYAASAVAAVSQSVLDGGKRFCVIVADASDPIPNAIYRKLGYEPSGEVVLIHFSERVSC